MSDGAVARRSPRVFILLGALLSVGAVSLIVAMAVLGPRLWRDLHDRFRLSLERFPVIQEQVGRIITLEVRSPEGDAAGEEGTIVLRVEGTIASGEVTAHVLDLGGEAMAIAGGTLRLDDGRSFPLDRPPAAPAEGR